MKADLQIFEDQDDSYIRVSRISWDGPVNQEALTDGLEDCLEAWRANANDPNDVPAGVYRLVVGDVVSDTREVHRTIKPFSTPDSEVSEQPHSEELASVVQEFLGRLDDVAPELLSRLLDESSDGVWFTRNAEEVTESTWSQRFCVMRLDPAEAGLTLTASQELPSGEHIEASGFIDTGSA